MMVTDTTGLRWESDARRGAGEGAGGCVRSDGAA